MILTENLLAFQDRKLYIFNCGHATTAYLGTIFHHQFVSEAINDMNNIFPIVEGAMKESGQALIKEYSDAFDDAGMDGYIQKTIGRFKNPEVVDFVTRVGRQPLRKLGRDERLLGPFHLAKRHGLSTKFLAIAIAATFLFRNEDDEQAVELRKVEESNGIEGVLKKLLNFESESEGYKEILNAYNNLNGRTKSLTSSEN